MFKFHYIIFSIHVLRSEILIHEVFKNIGCRFILHIIILLLIGFILTLIYSKLNDENNSILEILLRYPVLIISFTRHNPKLSTSLLVIALILSFSAIV